MSKDIQRTIQQFHNDPLGLLKELGGYYLRPPGGPLVAYAGKYPDGDGEKNFVGELYANFAKAERLPKIMSQWAAQLTFRALRPEMGIEVFVGAPEGGKAFATMLAYHNSLEYIYPAVREVKSDGPKPTKEFYWDRHELEAGKKVAIVEDVANNFSTTQKLLDLVAASGSEVIALICILNRSPHVNNVFKSKQGPIPVISLVRMPMTEYRQDDPKVKDDIASGNIMWKPKDPAQWAKLQTAMG